VSVKDDLAALCALEARIGALTAQRDDLRRRLLDHALDSYEKEGAAPTWRAELGTVGLTVPKPRVEVFNEDAFASFVADTYGPEHVVTVQRVPEGGLRSSLLDCVESDNVEIGVTVKARLPFLQVRLSKEAKAAAAAELAEERAA